MADVKVVLSPDPIFLQGSGGDPTAYDASSDRKFMQDAMGEGVRDLPTHFQASVVSGMTARFTPGVAYIRGKNTADQGTYRQYVGTDTDISAPAAHATLPRLDQVILRVLDYTHDNNDNALYEGRLEWIEGTATSGATLDNRLGAKDLTTLGEDSKSCILIWDYLMPAAATSITFGNFRDKRVRAVLGQGLSTITPTGIMNADISSSAAIAISKLAGYPSDSGKFLRGDGTWATIVVPVAKCACVTYDGAEIGGVGNWNYMTSWSNERADNDNMWSGAIPQRMTVNTPGYYMFVLSATQGNTIHSWVALDVNGASLALTNHFTVHCIQYMNAGNYVDARFFSYDGSNYRGYTHADFSAFQII